MKNIILVIALSLICNLSVANQQVESMSEQSYQIDIYGDHDGKARPVVKKYEKEIQKLMQAMQQWLYHSDHSPTEEKKLSKQKEVLTAKIQREAQALYVKIDPVSYPNEQTTYVTVEIVSQNEPERLRFVDAAGAGTPEKRTPPQIDLIEDMIHYQELAMQLVLEDPTISLDSCPVYHCTIGFNHNRLIPYLERFNHGAMQEKALILNTIKHDPDTARREAAVFLVGHFENPQDIITSLTPYVLDQSAAVRNSILRVLGATVMKAKITDLDLKPEFTLLSSVNDTDRNKALFVIWASANAKNKQLILKYAGQQLIELLKLKQPNNHLFAYRILTQLSGKNYKDTEVARWQKWINKTLT